MGTKPASSSTAISISATEFKAKCLQLMETVKRRQIAVTITKRGKPVAQLIPVSAEAASPVGFLRGSLVHADDLIAPDPESWADAPDPLDRSR